MSEVSPLLFGIDFTSAPRRAKPITLAQGCLLGSVLQVSQFEALPDWPSFEALLNREGPWLAALDLPFGLPLELVTTLGWPQDWPALIAHCREIGKAGFVAAMNAVREARPIGSRYIHRATDHPASSHSPMKLVNPPVGLMFYEGALRLAQAGVILPGMNEGDPQRVALEAYPGLLARRLAAGSYKSDDKRKQTPERAAQREHILQRIMQKESCLGFCVLISENMQTQVVADASGDTLDALLALCQAAWAWQRRDSNFGLPKDFHPVEGWIVSA